MADASDHLVLRNDEGQYCLWPGYADVPAGWRVVSGPGSRPACLAFIERSWTDMRPVTAPTPAAR
ncbi:MbtH family protein [Actinoplanes sp. NPDC049681]|uniref:MbtH family protein n=1 Tax=Actinoplanes sp. NPDC049681 TaxID=3363905 RepID=UPI00378BB555